MNLRPLSYFLTLVLCLLFAASCSQQKTYKIGVSQCSSDDWRTKMNHEIEREMMLHEDAVVEIRSADDSNQKQIADIAYFVENGFDIIIVAPNEATELTPVIDRVYAAGMPVIIFDRDILSDSYTARIGVDNVALGRAAARYALNITPAAPSAVEIYGLPGSTPAEDRHRGFTDEFTARGGTLAASAPGNWNPRDGRRAADSILAAHPGVDLVYAHNDRMAIAAAEVADSLGIRNKLKIIGIDAAPAIGIQAVADSVIDATFLYPTDGHRLVRTALAILRGEPFDREQSLPLASAVDASNADILLLQNETLADETRKMAVLKSNIDAYWARHSAQTTLFYACIVIIVLLVGLVFLVLRAYWQRRRHRALLEEQYHTIEAERDKQKELNRRLEEATQSKLMFFTNVSHDLRTPLALIAEPVAQLAASPALGEHDHTLAKIADKNVHILRRLINQILDFRKFENGKLDLSLAEIDLGKAVSEWAESFANLGRRRGLKLNIIPADTPLVAAVDPEKMERVLFNLLSNAFKYTPAGGEVTVTCGRRDDNVFFSVADTGEGISERDLGNIFERFFQVDKVHPNGSGIGLSLCKAFVELHGGTISVESRLREGSVFTVTLPVRHVADKPVEIHKAMPDDEIEAELDVIDTQTDFDNGRPLLLVIDDNADMRRLIAALLGAEYNIIEAPNGAEGLRRAARHVPDLIICDMMMPVMDGLECCHRLKEELSTSHIPVLMLTACSMEQQRVQGYESGVDGYLSKPFSADVLAARCRALIANRKRIQQLYQTTTATPVRTPANPRPQPQANTDIDSDFYNRFLEIFGRTMADASTSVDTIASEMGLERSQFYRKIKALTNYSPVELIRRLRLQEGRRLLTSTEKTVSEIAYETGFSTPAYFTKCYREAYGETPSETHSKLTPNNL